MEVHEQSMRVGLGWAGLGWVGFGLDWFGWTGISQQRKKDYMSCMTIWDKFF